MWYKFMGETQLCPKCKFEKEITALVCNAETHIKIEMRCLLCGDTSSVEYSLMVLKEFADDQDQKLQEGQTRKELVNDYAFLRSMHIEPNSQRRLH